MNIFVSSLAEKTAITPEAAFYLRSMIAEKREPCNSEFRLPGADPDAGRSKVGALIDPERSARKPSLPGQPVG